MVNINTPGRDPFLVYGDQSILKFGIITIVSQQMPSKGMYGILSICDRREEGEKGNN